MEINKDLTSPYILRKATDLWETLFELEGLATKKELHRLHAKMVRKLEVTPGAGVRASTVADFLVTQQCIQRQLCELYNYERMTFAKAIEEIMHEDELWTDLAQKPSLRQPPQTPILSGAADVEGGRRGQKRSPADALHNDDKRGKGGKGKGRETAQLRPDGLPVWWSSKWGFEDQGNKRIC